MTIVASKVQRTGVAQEVASWLEVARLMAGMIKDDPGSPGVDHWFPRHYFGLIRSEKGKNLAQKFSRSRTEKVF